MEETKYTWNDVIFSPDDPMAKGALGKECYFADNLEAVLKIANIDYKSEVLIELARGSMYPFGCILSEDDTEEDDTENTKKPTRYRFIVLKKETKRTYRPFKGDELPSLVGTIVRNKKNPSMRYTILGCTDKRVCMPEGNCICWYTPNDLLEYFMLVDGTPCGVEEAEE